MRIQAANSLGLSIDVQERMVPALHQGAELVWRCATLIQGLNRLVVPVMVTRHYPNGLGDTALPLRTALGPHQPMDKLSFSLLGEEEHRKAIEAAGRKTVLVFGAEAHVCVLQTVIDLREQGYEVVLVRDCISSRNPLDMEVALNRAEREGAVISTVESLLFEMVRRAGSDTFKAIHQLVK